MKTQRWKHKMSLFRSAFALASGTLLIALAAGAQAQHSKSGSSHPSGGGETESHSSHPSQSYASEQRYSSRSYTYTYSTSGNTRGYTSTTTRAAAQSGNPYSAGLIPMMGRGDTKSISNTSELYAGLVPGYYGYRGNTFGGMLLPGIPDDPTPSKDNDGKENGNNNKDSASNSSTSGSGYSGNGSITGVGGNIGTNFGTARPGTNSPSYQRFQESPEAAAARAEQNASSKSQILWPYTDISPFWAYTVDDLYWSPIVSLVGSPEGVVLDRILKSKSGKSSDYITDSPNPIPQAGVSRGKQGPTVQPGVTAKPPLPADLQEALNDIQRAFRNYSSGPLGRHLLHQESLTFNAPGELPHFVTADKFTENFTKLFEGRRTNGLVFEEPKPLGSDQFTVTAWYSYHDNTLAVDGVVAIRLVLRTANNHVYLTAFDM